MGFFKKLFKTVAKVSTFGAYKGGSGGGGGSIEMSNPATAQEQIKGDPSEEQSKDDSSTASAKVRRKRGKKALTIQTPATGVSNTPTKGVSS